MEFGVLDFSPQCGISLLDCRGHPPRILANLGNAYIAYQLGSGFGTAQDPPSRRTTGAILGGFWCPWFLWVRGLRALGLRSSYEFEQCLGRHVLMEELQAGSAC